MRKGRDGGKKKGKTGKKKRKRLMKIVATTSLPAVDRPNADRWNTTRSRQKNGHIAIELLCNLKQQSGGTKFKESIFDIWSMKSPRSGGKMVSAKSPRFQDFPQIWGKMALNLCDFLIFFLWIQTSIPKTWLFIYSICQNKIFQVNIPF